MSCKVSSYETRQALLARDGDSCVYCGSALVLDAEDATRGWSVDHLTPVSRGGSDHLSNLALACRSCNAKGAKTAEEFALWHLGPAFSDLGRRMGLCWLGRLV